MQYILLTILSLLLFVQEPVFGQAENFTFYNLNEKDGLSQNAINSFLKDSRGSLWVGTQNGLNRFDGSNFYSFKRKKKSNGIPHGDIHSLCEDKSGNIWGATSNGIFSYAPEVNRFDTYFAPENSYNNAFLNILCDEQGNIWTTNSIELFKFNRAANAFQRIARSGVAGDSVNNYFIRKNGLLRDALNNGFWIATRLGLLFYDVKRNKLTTSYDAPGDPIFARRSVAALARSPKGYFWFFDNESKEIVAFDPAKKTILQTINISKEMPGATGATLFEDRQNRLWFSSWTYESLTINQGTNTIEKLKGSFVDGHATGIDFFWTAMQDENGTIWLGTAAGITMCNPGKESYKAYQLPGKIPQLNKTVLTIIEEDPIDRSWWLATENKLVIHYFPGSEKYESFDLKTAPLSKNGSRPGAIYFLFFLDDHLLILTTTGAWQIERGQRSIKPLDLLPEPYASMVIRSLVPPTDSIVYFTDGYKLFSLNSNTRIAGPVMYQQRTLADWNISGFSHVLKKKGQALWFVTGGSKIASLQKDNQPLLFEMIKNDRLEGGGYFNSMDMDARGDLWICNTGVGLYRYKPASTDVRYWNEEDGLVNDYIHKIKVDDRGRVWAIAFNKVSVFDPGLSRFTNFIVPYGQSKTNYDNWLIKRADGIMTATISNDIFEFYPGNLGHTPVKKMPGLSLENLPGGEHLLATEKKLVLNPDENSLRFKFGLLVDAAFFPHDFEYLLEGSDRQWAKAGGNEAVYNNLPPGNYRFRLIAKGKNNAWQSEERVLDITIKTPFYRSWWFFFLCVLVVAAMLFIIYRNRIFQKRRLMRLETKAQLLEKEKAMVMYESLKQQLNPHFLFNSLTSLSGLIDTDQEHAGEFLEQMSGIYRYILKNGDQETVALRDEIEFVQLYINLQQTRFKKGLVVNIDVPDDLLHYKIAPVTLQNLIENAIKHNIIDAEAPLVIDIFVEDDYLVVKNNLQKKSMVETSNKKGLAQFITLYKYLSEKPIVVEESSNSFIIKIPLI